jgi:hypothetical protein
VKETDDSSSSAITSVFKVMGLRAAGTLRRGRLLADSEDVLDDDGPAKEEVLLESPLVSE